MDNRLVSSELNWQPRRRIDSILTEIADHAARNPDWLRLANAV
jgi:hypothetical protein